MNMSQRMVTTSRPIVTSSLWEEVRTQFHNDIASPMLKYNIPDELILNNDQTPSKSVPIENVSFLAGLMSLTVGLFWKFSL